MLSTGLLFAMITTISWSIGIFPFTQAARRLGTHSLNCFRLLLAMLIIGTISVFISSENFIVIFSPQYSYEWLWLGLSGLIGLTIGDYFAFVTYSILGARIGSVLTTFAPAAALITGALLIEERISFIGILGIIITITGVNFVSLGKSEREKIPDHGHGSIAYGIAAGILGALCQGAGLVLAKKGMMSDNDPLNPVNATFMRLSVAAVSMILFTLLSGQTREILSPIFSNRNKGIIYAVSGTLFGPVFGVCMSLFTVSLLEPSVAQTIFSFVPAFALLLSVIFLKDKISLKSLIGLLVAIGGVIILIWRDEIDNFL